MSGRPLPSWAQAIEPVDMDGAAAVLGISRRTLVDVIGQHRHYERRGNRKVFYPEHISALREALACQASRSNGGEALPTPPAPSLESVFEKALARATRRKLVLPDRIELSTSPLPRPWP